MAFKDVFINVIFFFTMRCVSSSLWSLPQMWQAAIGQEPALASTADRVPSELDKESTGSQMLKSARTK